MVMSGWGTGGFHFTRAKEEEKSEGETGEVRLGGGETGEGRLGGGETD